MEVKIPRAERVLGAAAALTHAAVSL